MQALRRQVEAIQWRTRLLELEAKDVSERTKDIHLLRITRSMQRILQMPGRPARSSDVAWGVSSHDNWNCASLAAAVTKQQLLSALLLASMQKKIMALP